MIDLQPFHVTEPTPSGGEYTVSVTRSGASLWRVSWSLIRDRRVVGGSKTRRSESAAIATAERVLVSVRRLVAAKEAA